MERWSYCHMDPDKIQVLGIFCPLCGADTGLIWREKNLIARRCKKCRVIFCPSSKETHSIYDERYFERWYIRMRFRRKRYLKKLIEKIEKILNLQPGSLLDIGCGAGIFLEIMKEKGWEISATEISPYACRYCKENGFDVICCQLEEAGFLDSNFDLVTILDVIAHLHKPQNYLKEIHRILKQDGLLVIKTPHHPSFLFVFANLFSFTNRSRSLLHIPAQIFHFTPGSIKKFLSRNGFHILSIIRVNDIPAFLLSFSLKSMCILLEQLFLRAVFGSDSLVVIARKKFHI
ncbi:MAG: class I SAM-dependent methyltransferase [Candidatus Omnitrophica bacterium]|nr:class I SAM-dependent methyltransferase [Candidatus Omnitrophota bacterium]MCM8789324.1 class I SAM-dependent methyltransferase [Candidatus Omnitrophota bacterium]